MPWGQMTGKRFPFFLVVHEPSCRTSSWSIGWTHMMPAFLSLCWLASVSTNWTTRNQPQESKRRTERTSSTTRSSPSWWRLTDDRDEVLTSVLSFVLAVGMRMREWKRRWNVWSSRPRAPEVLTFHSFFFIFSSFSSPGGNEETWKEDKRKERNVCTWCARP